MQEIWGRRIVWNGTHRPPNPPHPNTSTTVETPLLLLGDGWPDCLLINWIVSLINGQDKDEAAKYATSNSTLTEECESIQENLQDTWSWLLLWKIDSKECTVPFDFFYSKCTVRWRRVVSTKTAEGRMISPVIQSAEQKVEIEISIPTPSFPHILMPSLDIHNKSGRRLKWIFWHFITNPWHSSRPSVTSL